MLNLGNCKGNISKTSKTSSGGGDDDLTSLSWLQTVNILPDSVASDDDLGGPSSPETEPEKLIFKKVDSILKPSSKPTKPTKPTTGNTFRLSNSSSRFSSNIIITSTSAAGTTTTYSPSVLLVSTASSSMERRSPFNVGEKNIVVVSTPTQNGVYPDIRTTSNVPAQVRLTNN